ncbi:hypothetical protein [Hymenobacter nivis]|uniref:Uncharacterized protein n=1 Tax=Hymenobacter nivis TaxID=1850093 RepID=A0A502GZH0_9BACT|nr:hypothetical protein [Hymenobacter nivis]TPG66540.1 hypothetical protein EAH73_09050 [Hymenobacter nivis]
MLRTRWLLAAALPLLGSCRPDSPLEVPPRLKPLLETLAAGYRPLNRQDTLSSFWAPDSLVADSTFQFTDAYRSRVLLRVRFVPASAATAAGLDTLRFRGTYLGLDKYTRPGYHWNFFPGRNPEPTVASTADEVPLRMALTYSWRLALLEHQAWPGTSVVHERNSYLMDYPFEAVATARVSDSVVRARLWAAGQPASARYALHLLPRRAAAQAHPAGGRPARYYPPRPAAPELPGA